MAFYSYKMTRDYGFAPNPFGGVCTLATCKPSIRKKAEVGDWIIGTGAKEIHLEYRLIYLMRVTEKLTLTDYWNDPRFQFKKPILNGSLVTIHGDNVYSKNENGDWEQAKCQHSNTRNEIREKHIKTDTNGEFVLISDQFYCFGENSIKIIDKFRKLCCKKQGHLAFRKNNPQIELCKEFIRDITKTLSIGVHGDSIHWRLYDQLSLF